ncbi:hypothetical protein [Bacillus pinisoli]|uniref:hypothetical protein n=1 Tax=Bacillus pinisoli TaxID=2901866 RepID=UPI001FF565C7|nr:hypothetical protein [Bacillus pinisoli]
MVAELNKKIRIAQEQIRMKRKLEKQLDASNQELEQVTMKLDNLRAVLHMEYQDVEKLEGLSINAIFLTMLGTKEERLLQEKQETALVKLQYDEAKAEVRALQDEILTLQHMLAGIQDTERELQKYHLEKERVLKAKQSTYLLKLDSLDEKVVSLHLHKQDLEEALIAAESVKTCLKNAVASLESAKGWGSFDIFGGGILATALKHNHLDDAKSYMQDAQFLAKKLHKELEDIGPEFTETIELSYLTKFADYFFDGLITDWVIQNQITDSLEQVKAYNDHLLAIVRRIHAAQLRVITQINNLDLEKKQLVEEAV